MLCWHQINVQTIGGMRNGRRFRGIGFCINNIIKHITNIIALKILQRENYNNIIFYSDGCGYQNRNIILLNALLSFSINNNIVIEQKYLVNCHTQMACNSVHSTNERSLKKYQNLFTIRLC